MTPVHSHSFRFDAGPLVLLAGYSALVDTATTWWILLVHPSWESNVLVQGLARRVRVGSDGRAGNRTDGRFAAAIPRLHAI